MINVYKRGFSGWAKHADFIVLDVISLQIACVLAYILRFDRDIILYQDNLYASLALVLAVMDVLLCIVLNTMHNVLRRGRFQELAATLRQTLCVFALMMVYLVSAKTSSAYSRIILYTIFPLYAVFGYALRMLYKLSLIRLFFRERRRSMIVVADEKSVSGILESIAANANEQLKVMGLVLTDADKKGETVSGIAVVENIGEAAEYICREWVDEVLIGSTQQDERVDKLVRDCKEMGVVVHVVLPVEKTASEKAFVERLAGYTVLTSSVNYATPLQAALKRAMDIAGGLVGCVLALIVIAIVGPKIRKASPGPIIYSQERMGRNGKRFKFYKIRSMYLDADERKAKLMDQNRVSG